jgi:hypothetical protein
MPPSALRRRVGDAGQPGSCLRACGKCAPCAPGDRACYNALRRAAGHLEAEEAEAHLFPALRPEGPPGGGGEGGGGDSDSAGSGSAHTELR